MLRSGAHSTLRRRSALSPARPPAGKRARRAEAPSPATRTGPHSAVRSRLRCRTAASPVIMAQARPRGRWLWTRCPLPPGGPDSPPGPSGAHRPAAAAPQRAQDPRRSQKTQGHGPQLGRPLHAALTLAPASSPSAPGGCRSNQQAAPWGRGSRTSVHSPCVRTQPRLPGGPGLRSRAAGKVGGVENLGFPKTVC